jgi:hypothetical protein
MLHNKNKLALAVVAIALANISNAHAANGYFQMGLGVDVFSAKYNSLSNVTTTPTPEAAASAVQGSVVHYFGVEHYMHKIYLAGELGLSFQFGGTNSQFSSLTYTDAFNGNVAANMIGGTAGAASFTSIGTEARMKFGYQVSNHATVYAIVGYINRILPISGDISNTLNFGASHGVQGGVGMIYRMNKHLGLFAEATVPVFISMPTSSTSEVLVMPRASLGFQVSF